MADVRADLVVVDLGERASGDDRGADGAEGDRRGVGQQSNSGGTQRREADGHQHDSGDRDGRSEAGEGFEHRTETEGDDDRLDTRVVRDEVEGCAQVVEAAAHDGDLVEHDRAEDDPHDREETEDRTLGRGQQCEVHGHLERQDGDEDRDGQRRQAGPVGLPSQCAERDENGEEGQQTHQCGQPEAVGHRRQRWGEGARHRGAFRTRPNGQTKDVMHTIATSLRLPASHVAALACRRRLPAWSGARPTLLGCRKMTHGLRGPRHGKWSSAGWRNGSSTVGWFVDRCCPPNAS